MAPTAAPAASYPITIENCGRKLTFDKAPSRVVSLWQPPNELLLALGLQDNIVALAGNYTDLRPDLAPLAAKIKIIGTSMQWPSKEVLLSEKPDMVISEGIEGFMYDTAQGYPSVAEIEATGAKVLSTGGSCTPSDPKTQTKTTQQVYDDLLMLGKVFGVSDRATALVKQLQDREAAVVTKVAGKPPVKVAFYNGGEGPVNVLTVGIWADLMRKAGGQDVITSASYQVSNEEFAAGQPEVILIGTYPGQDAATSIAFLKKTFPNVPAVQNDRLVPIATIDTEASVRVVDGLEQIAKALHPEAFAGATTTSYPVTIENCGKTLTFTKAPERILVTYQNVAEILVKLGLKDKIVGVTYGKAYPSPADMQAEIDGLNYLSPPGKGSAAKEIEFSTRPDIVIAAYPTYDFDPAQGMATQEDFAAAGAQVYGISAECATSVPGGTIETVYSDMLNFGKIFGVTPRAQAVVQGIKNRIATVQAKVGKLPPIPVAFYDAGEDQLGFYGSGLNSDMIALAGGANVFAGQSEVYLQVSKEAFAVKNPAIFAVLDYEGSNNAPDEIERANFLFKTFPNMPASKDKRWVAVPGSAFAAGIRIPEAIETMAKAFHPEAFK